MIYCIVLLVSVLALAVCPYIAGILDDRRRTLKILQDVRDVVSERYGGMFMETMDKVFDQLEDRIDGTDHQVPDI